MCMVVIVLEELSPIFAVLVAFVNMCMCIKLPSNSGLLR